MFTIETDVYTTRRQRLHHIFDETATLRWSGKNIDSALRWLIENHQIECHLHGSDFKFHLSIAPVAG